MVGDAVTFGNDSLTQNLNQTKFSTQERDNDKNTNYDCAKEINKCGWWMNSCTKANINDVYNATDSYMV